MRYHKAPTLILFVLLCLKVLNDQFGTLLAQFMAPTVLKEGQAITELLLISIDANVG